MNVLVDLIGQRFTLGFRGPPDHDHAHQVNQGDDRTHAGSYSNSSPDDASTTALRHEQLKFL